MERRKSIVMTAAAAPSMSPISAVDSKAQQAKLVKLDYKRHMKVKDKVDGVKTEGFSLASLKEKERKLAQEVREITSALLLKGLLHRLNSEKYPLPSTSATPESMAFEMVSKISLTAFERMRPRLKMLMKEPEKLQVVLGSLWQIDFRKVSLMPYFKKLSIKPTQHEPKPVMGIPDPTPPPPPPPPAPVGPKYRRLDLLLRTVHCVDETDPEGGADEIVLGGGKVEANGGVGILNSFQCGDFDDRWLQDFGVIPLAQYDLTNTAGYPKTVYAIIQLVESDGEDEEVAEGLTNLFSAAAGLAGLFSAGAGTILGGLIQAVGALIGLFIDEDYFPPFGIHLTLNSENEFGGPTSGNRTTANIVGHGGTYRIGYQWILNA